MAEESFAAISLGCFAVDRPRPHTAALKPTSDRMAIEAEGPKGRLTTSSPPAWRNPARARCRATQAALSSDQRHWRGPFLPCSSRESPRRGAEAGAPEPSSHQGSRKPAVRAGPLRVGKASTTKHQSEKMCAKRLLSAFLALSASASQGTRDPPLERDGHRFVAAAHRHEGCLGHSATARPNATENDG